MNGYGEGGLEGQKRGEKGGFVAPVSAHEGRQEKKKMNRQKFHAFSPLSQLLCFFWHQGLMEEVVDNV